MKKFLAVLAIAGTLVACNDSSTSTNGDDTTMNKDTNTVIENNVPPVQDTTGNSTPVSGDTTAMRDTISK